MAQITIIAALPPLRYTGDSLLHPQQAMVRENIRVPWQLDVSILESSLVAGHIVAIPVERQHYLFDSSAVS